MHLDNWNSFENSPLNDEKMLELPELVYLFELVILHFVFTCSRLQTWRPPSLLVMVQRLLHQPPLCGNMK